MVLVTLDRGEIEVTLVRHLERKFIVKLVVKYLCGHGTIMSGDHQHQQPPAT